MRQPLVTVAIPCYNQARFLGEAIESVLSQTYRHFEVVVVDDGSTDETSEVASGYYGEGVLLIRQENRGLSEARNRGLEEAKGEYVVFLDSDDRLLPEALEVGVKELEAHPECAFVSGNCRLIAADGSHLSNPRGARIEENHYLELLRYNYLWTPAVAMFQRSFFKDVGTFDRRVNAAADWDLYLRAARRFPVFHHGKVVTEYRQHGTNMTGDPALMLRHSVAVLRSQREYVKGKEQYEWAYRIGLRDAKEFYGGPLAEQVRAYIGHRQWGRALRGVLALLRYYHQGMALLDERRSQRHKITQRLGALERELQTCEKELRERRQWLDTPERSSEEQRGGRVGGAELRKVIRRQREEVRWLRGRIRHLTAQSEELDRRSGRGTRMLVIWKPLSKVASLGGRLKR